jgi:CheY-like chemotaxis protein/chromosome segregation ATPase
MSEQRSGGASPSRAVLTALRAAAILIVATGLNDIIAGAVVRYEPLYLYLGAVALATLLDGIVIGAVTAAIATFLYALLFGPRPPVLETSVGLPAIGGALVVVAFGAIGAAWRRMRRNRRTYQPEPDHDEPSGDTPLLEASIVTPAEEIVTALEEMRADLRGALAELSAARDRERSLEHELRVARTAASDDAERIVAGANRAIDALSARVQQVEEHSRSRETRLEEAWAEAREALGAQIRTLEAELTRERARVDTSDRAEADVVAARLEISQLEAEREAAEATANKLAQRIAELESELIESEEKRLDASTADALKAEREAAQATSASLAQRVAELESEIEAAADERNDDVIAARLEVSQLAQRVNELEAALDVANTERDQLRAATVTVQAEFDAKLQSIVAHLAEDHEQDLGNAIMEKEAVRAEARGMTAKMGQLQQKFEEERDKWLAQKQALTEKLQQAEERAARAVEDTTRVMTDARASWQAELGRLRGRVAELEQPPAAPVDLTQPIPMPPPPGAEPVHRPRIVVVHPDMELREAARSSLVRVGYDVATAADGLEGLRVAIAMKPDIVIADSQMPKMDGRELCQLLKSQDKTAHIKIVLLTRTAGERVDGADEVLKKPVPFDVLRNALTGLLAR